MARSVPPGDQSRRFGTIARSSLVVEIDGRCSRLMLATVHALPIAPAAYAFSRSAWRSTAKSHGLRSVLRIRVDQFVDRHRATIFHHGRRREEKPVDRAKLFGNASIVRDLRKNLDVFDAAE